jgi:glycosyltransferase involved in cell wall biosynthesis
MSRLLGAQSLLALPLLGVVGGVVKTYRPSVIHANGLHFQSTLAAAAFHGGVPLVTSCHIADLQWLPWSMRLPTNAYERTAGRFILGRSRRVIAVSEAVRDHVVALGCPRDRVVVVRNGVDHERFRSRHQDSPGQGSPGIAFVGRLIENKGPGLLLLAASQLIRRGLDFTLTFVGTGPQQDRLQATARRLGLGPVTRFVGQVEDVAGELQQAEIFVRPSLTEGMSLTIVEAMACGVCVVASDIPANRELIVHGKTGMLVTPADASALAATLESLILDAGLRSRLAAAGHDAARSFSWDACAEATAQVLTATAREPELAA